MDRKFNKTRVLIVTPEIAYLPNRMGRAANFFTAKAGGLADMMAALISSLFYQGVDVHVALPNYRSIFKGLTDPLLKKKQHTIQHIMSNECVHLAQDRAFFYLDRIYSNSDNENIHTALAFQREVINNIIPRVRPDLIHCNDWMTGLIPAMARKLRIPCLFTIHSIHTAKTTLADIEDRGIDAAYFWNNLHYVNYVSEYKAVRESIPVDFLSSGVFASHFVNTVSTRFLEEIVQGRHAFVESHLRQELINKLETGCAVGILNAPDQAFLPVDDKRLPFTYGPNQHASSKPKNKLSLQKRLGLIEDEKAPVFFWPSRLDPVQKGCRLFSDIFYNVISKYWQDNLQVIFVANGDWQKVFRDIVNFHQLHHRVAVCDFSQRLEHMAYGASDFILMPSLFEPCGLPQMIGQKYGTLPVVNDTGGLHDTVHHLDPVNGTGNGFLFKNYDSDGLMWAIDQAMAFHHLPPGIKNSNISRIMRESMENFNHTVNVQQYINLYERILENRSRSFHKKNWASVENFQATLQRRRKTA